VHLQADQEADLAQGLQRRRRVRQVVRVDPADDQRAELARRGGVEDLGGGAARRRGQRAGGQAPDPLDVGACGVVGDRATARQQRGQGTGLDRAALPRPTRHPADGGAGALGEPGDSREQARHLGGPLPDEDDAPTGEGLDDVRGDVRQVGEHGRLGARHRADQAVAGGRLGGAALDGRPQHRRGGPLAEVEDLLPVLLRGLTQPQEDDRRLLLGLQRHAQHRGRGLEPGVAQPLWALADDMCGEEVELLGAVRAGPEVDIVRAGGDAGELGVRVGVLDREPAPGQHPDPALAACGVVGRSTCVPRGVIGRSTCVPRGVIGRSTCVPRGVIGRSTCVPRGEQTLGGHPERVRPRRLGQHAVAAAHHRPGDTALAREVAEREAAPVVDPLLVHLGVVAGQPAHHRAAPGVDADGAAAGAVLADTGGGHQVERARPEPVRRAGQRTHRADLDGVAREVRLERLVLGDADLLLGTALEQAR
jgi:hypothetical protein